MCVCGGGGGGGGGGVGAGIISCTYYEYVEGDWRSQLITELDRPCMGWRKAMHNEPDNGEMDNGIQQKWV